jgi:trehalose/maltose hydrolase-like predicted phosphorylase
MAVWLLNHARELLELLPEDVCAELCDKLDLKAHEIRLWKDISHKMHILP